MFTLRRAIYRRLTFSHFAHAGLKVIRWDGDTAVFSSPTEGSLKTCTIFRAQHAGRTLVRNWPCDLARAVKGNVAGLLVPTAGLLYSNLPPDFSGMFRTESLVLSM